MDRRTGGAVAQGPYEIRGYEVADDARPRAAMASTPPLLKWRYTSTVPEAYLRFN
jgi:hypothetical protein